MSWAQAAGHGADRGTGPQAHSHIPVLHFGMGFGQGQHMLGVNLISEISFSRECHFMPSVPMSSSPPNRGQQLPTDPFSSGSAP